MRINEEGLDLIKSCEGLRLVSYPDVTGIWTIGYGHTGSDVAEGQAISVQQAADLLIADIARTEHGVTEALEVEVNPNQFSAMVSFAYNVGLGNFQKSSLLRFTNQEKFEEAALSFERWIYAGGHTVSGLIKRRGLEEQLYKKAVT